jgi:hypothetical protein
MKLSVLLKTPPTTVAALLALRSFSEDEIRAELGERVKDVGYEKLVPLDRYGEKGQPNAYFFFRGKQLVMVYSGVDAYLAKLSMPAIEKELGPAEKVVRSRQGKTANMHLYPSKGFACSEDHDEIGFVEIFPPMSLKDYLAEIYEDVGPFIK